MINLPNTLNRVLIQLGVHGQNLRAQYEAEFINERFALTDKGKRALLQILAVKYETDLSERATQLNTEARARRNGEAPSACTPSGDGE